MANRFQLIADHLKAVCEEFENRDFLDNHAMPALRIEIRKSREILRSLRHDVAMLAELE